MLPVACFLQTKYSCFPCHLVTRMSTKILTEQSSLLLPHKKINGMNDSVMFFLIALES